MHNFDDFIYSKQSGYDETVTRRAFEKAVPLRTVVIYCFDPRAIGIPEAVAREFGEIFPGDILTNENGKKVASTATMFEVVVAGGRAIDALRSLTVAQHLFGLENIVVVHHTFCGATTFTPEGIIKAFKTEHGLDISEAYSRESICISDFNVSLRHDVKLIRDSRGTPSTVDIFGYVYDIDKHQLVQVVSDLAKRHELNL